MLYAHMSTGMAFDICFYLKLNNLDKSKQIIRIIDDGFGAWILFVLTIPQNIKSQEIASFY